MILYEMLSLTQYFQDVWIYITNAYDQNMPVFKGEVGDARADEDVFYLLTNKVEHYECSTGILLIKVSDEYFNKRFEDSGQYNSKLWTKEKRPYVHSYEIDKELFAILNNC